MGSFWLSAENLFFGRVKLQHRQALHRIDHQLRLLFAVKSV